MMDRKIRIGLAEDKVVNRNAFISKVNQMNNCELVLNAHNGRDCLDQLKGLPESRKPDVIFMDIEMPYMDGIETVAYARQLYPSMHFIILTVFDDDDKVFDAIKAGAEGYLLKHESAAVLEDAINNVLTYGGAPMSPAIARKTLQLLHHADRPTVTQPLQQSSDLPSDMSEREMEVLQMMVNGLDAKSIATKIDLSVHTVRKHIANIYDKLHINSKAQAISLAHRQGWFKG
ncbi:MAG: response regulator transcription factor [Bacteroidetes bacterium]|mgnify:CR=1 FL=1|jgi:DNA-binding NarL/FixJ family response regulator|nr:response regulator transcription factor [Bacteroidota bacterium]